MSNKPFAIVRGEAELNRLVSSAASAYTKASLKMHVAIVSALVHASVTGRTQPLNRLYSVLNTNDQQAFRGSYLPRIHAAIGGMDFSKYADQPVPSEILNAFKDKGQWLGFGKNKASGENEFYVISKDINPLAPGNRKQFAILAEVSLINPKEEAGWRKFFDRNNFSELKVFGDDDVYNTLKQVVAKGKGENKSTESKVSKQVQKIINDALEAVSTIRSANVVHDERLALEKLTAVAETKARAVKPKAKAAAKSLH